MQSFKVLKNNLLLPLFAWKAKLMKQQRCSYFRSKWNLLDLTIILLSWSGVAVFIQRTLLGNRDLDHYQNHKDQ